MSEGQFQIQCIEYPEDNLELIKFLDAIGFKNSCCDCCNSSYKIEKPFTAIIGQKGSNDTSTG